MWGASNAFGRMLPRPYGAWISGALAFWLAFGGLDGAQAREQEAKIPIGRTAPSEEWTPVERWAWSQIEKGETADLNERCRTPALDPKQEKDARWWQDKCRMLRGTFVSELLTKAPWREATPFAGVALSGARIVGNVGLRNAKLVRGVVILSSRIEGGIELMRAHTESLISLRGSLITGAIFADGLHSETALDLGSAVFKEGVSLGGAKVGGQVAMVGATFDGRLDADSLVVGGSLLMRSEGGNKASFKHVNLRGAKVTGQVDITGAAFDDKLDADSLEVGGSLHMRSEGQNKASFKDVNLNGAKVTGQVVMDGATFDGRIDADSLQVGNMLLMRSKGENKASFKGVNLQGAKVTGLVSMLGASFEGELNADNLRVGSDVVMRDARYAKKSTLAFGHIDGNLDLRGAELADLNLWGASVNGDLRLGVGDNGSRTVWNGRLNLRNAHAGNLMDTTESWPANEGQLLLDGFTFAHVGGTEQDQKKELERPLRWWDSWARRDPEYSPTPYAQLAAALKNSGDADAADDIRFLGRERARQTVCEKGQYLPCLLQSVLGFGVGYGIGVYTFRALGWVLLLSFVSMFILKVSVKEAEGARKSWLWCFGASLSRLLPGVDLSKEFADFFDGPFRPRFNFWQGSWFWFTRFAGVVLGAALIAAIAGLTRGS